MVRTKGDRVPTRAVGSKAPGKIKAATASMKTKHKKKTGGGHSRAHPRETPKWQKPITSFIDRVPKTTENEVSTSKEEIEDQDPSHVEECTGEEASNLDVDECTDEEAPNLDVDLDDDLDDKSTNEKAPNLDVEESTDEEDSD